MGLFKPITPKLDLSNSITSGLLFDLELSEGAGTTVTDLLTSASGTFRGTPTWIQTTYGYGLDFDSNTEGIDFTSLAAGAQNAGNLYSIEVLGTRDTGGSGTAYGAFVFKKNGTADTGNRVWEFENDNGSVGQGMAFQFWFSSSLGKWTIAYPTAGDFYHWVITFDASSTANNPIWYVNGSSASVTQRVSPSGTARADGANLYIGNNSPAFTSGWDGKIVYVRYWNRILTSTEAGLLYQNPWRMHLPVGNIPNGYRHVSVGNGMGRSESAT